MKKLLSFIFAMIIILEIIPVLSFAEESECILFGGVEIPKNITKICIGSDERMEKGIDTYSAEFISNVNIKELYQKLPDLERISIAKCKVRNFGYFSKFKHLEALELYNCTGISGLEFVPNCRKLTEFAFTQDGLKDISEIGRMTRLKKLTIADATTYGYTTNKYIELKKKVQNGDHLRDLSPLGNLTELTELTVEGAAIEDITPLANMQKLTTLTLSNAIKTDLSPLGNLENLKSFTLTNSGQRFIKQSAQYDYIELPSLEHLTYLSLNHSNIYDDVLDGFPELKTLNLTDSNVRSRNGKYEYSSGQKLPKLETMTLNNVSIADNLISQFTSLKTLNISGSRIVDTAKTKTSISSVNYSLNYLKNLKKLKSLTVYHCYINDISGLKKLSNLEYLDLTNNTLKDLTPLKNLKKLKYLDLSDALDGDSSERYYGDDVLSSLINLKKLEYLDISGIYDLPEDYGLWKPNVKNSIFDVLVSLPKLKILTISPIYEYGNLMEEEETERIKLFEEKMPYCELNIEYPDIAF